jgi:flagellar biosynthesis protein FlhA
VITHLSEIVRRRAGKLLGRSDVKALVDGVRATDPTVADELVAAGVTMGEVQKVLSGLLEEGVPVRDLVRILEVVSERARVTRVTEQLIEAVRVELGGAISSAHAKGGVLRAVALDAQFEGALAERLRISENGTFLDLDSEMAERLTSGVSEKIGVGASGGSNPVLLCAGALRSSLSRTLKGVLPGVPVLSYQEIGDHLDVDLVGTVSLVP